MLAIAHRIYQSSDNPSDGSGSLWDAVGTGAADNSAMHGRPSITMPLRYAVEAPLRLLTRR